jgi:hypothetical protein
LTIKSVAKKRAQTEANEQIVLALSHDVVQDNAHGLEYTEMAKQVCGELVRHQTETRWS